MIIEDGLQSGALPLRAGLFGFGAAGVERAAFGDGGEGGHGAFDGREPFAVVVKAR